jgi:hypothetical protein
MNVNFKDNLNNESIEIINCWNTNSRFGQETISQL